VIADYRREYKQRRPHRRLGYLSPSRFAAQSSSVPGADATHMNTDISLPAVANLDFVEPLYAEYLRNPSSVTFFTLLALGGSQAVEQLRRVITGGG